MTLLRAPDPDDEPAAPSWAWLVQRHGVLVLAGIVALLLVGTRACAQRQAPEFQHGINLQGVDP